jgi:hypothetical protein
MAGSKIVLHGSNLPGSNFWQLFVEVHTAEQKRKYRGFSNSEFRRQSSHILTGHLKHFVR